MPRLKPKKAPLTKEERAEISRKNGAKNKGRPSQVYKPAPPLPKIDPNDYDFMSDMYHPLAQYTPEQKLSAVLAYFETGTTRGASRICGVNQQLISEWKNKSQWWPAAYEKVKKDRQDELDANLTSLIDLAFEEAKDRIMNGDEVIDKNGEIVRRKMGGKELVTSAAIMVDKRAIIRGDPTTISANKNTDPKLLLEQLGEQFTKIAKEHLDKSVVKTVGDDIDGGTT